MKLRKILAAAVAMTIVCGAPAAVGTYQPGYELTANAGDRTEVVENGIKYFVYADYAEVARNEGIAGDVNIASAVNGVPVTSIGFRAFEECQELTSITIPDGVTIIDDRAFCECSELASITIPDSLTSIGDDVFVSCSKLTSITLPEGLTSIGCDAFDECSGLTSITIPDSVTSIGYGAFYLCSGLTSIIIPDGITSIGDWTFYGCSALTSVTIPESVTSISDKAFTDHSDVTIYGYGGSYAETYANEKDIPFAAIEKAPATTSQPTTTTTTTTTKPTTTTTEATTTSATTAITIDYIGQATSPIAQIDKYTETEIAMPFLYTPNVSSSWIHDIDFDVQCDDKDVTILDKRLAVEHSSYTLAYFKPMVKVKVSKSGDFVLNMVINKVTDTNGNDITYRVKDKNVSQVFQVIETRTTKSQLTTVPSTTTTLATTTTATVSEISSNPPTTNKYYQTISAQIVTYEGMEEEFRLASFGELKNAAPEVESIDYTVQCENDGITILKKYFKTEYDDIAGEVHYHPIIRIKANKVGEYVIKMVINKVTDKDGNDVTYRLRIKELTNDVVVLANPVSTTYTTTSTILTTKAPYYLTTTATSTASTTTTASTKAQETTTTTTATPEQPAVSFGDPTGDGKIDAKDASFALVEYAKLSTGGESSLTEAEKSAADVNKDGKNDSKDASIILSYYAYISTNGTDSLEEFLKK